jgi:hypothetical protein
MGAGVLVGSSVSHYVPQAYAESGANTGMHHSDRLSEKLKR